jgi:NAD(P)H-hydrate epimerase
MSSSRPRTHISAAVAAEVDRRLMADDGVGYKLEQLMELAGLSVAATVADVAGSQGPDSVVVVVCGPGNNGGDGLVAARHIRLMGFADVSVVCPINRFPALTSQLLAFGVPFVDAVSERATIVVDALFGFSFRPPVTGPFRALISQMSRARAVLVSVDVPSGWDVDRGNVSPSDAIREPNALVSLTAPKLASLHLSPSALHYVGGRFVPPSLASEMGFLLPHYPGACQIALLATAGRGDPAGVR